MKEKEQLATWKHERNSKSNDTRDNPKYSTHFHSNIPGGGDSKSRYHILATPLPHIVIPSSSSSKILHGLSWDEWHDHLWNESSQPIHNFHFPSSIGFRSLQEHNENDSNNHTVSSSLSMFIRLHDEDTIRRSLVEISSTPLQGKIYYLRPTKKNKHGKTHSATATSGSVVIPLPDLMDPPPKWKLGQEVSTMEQDLPFGGALPKAQPGKEVNLRAKKSFQYANRKNRKDPFRNHLNWATTDNPDRVPLVHDPIDQGACGSCWAYVTTGSLETSLARRVAQAVYWQQLNHSTTTTDNGTSNDTDLSNTTRTNNSTTASTNNTPSRRMRRSAAAMAQWVESLVFNQTRLSIQELLDCDTQIDQGCIGGNPLLAFFYIHKYGLMSWDRYPYAGTRLDACARSDRRDVSQYHFPTTTTNNHNGRGARAAPTPSSFPLATVDSWGILPKNHEDIIQVALRYIGPVTVAINGGDDDFIRYSGGIFDKESCSQEANHAVLIVGYGQEEIERKDRSIEIIRYWIARNSWGPLWGENGYIRIARGSGKKKVPGVCGIARSPSVALGGRLLFSPWWGSEVADSGTTTSSSSPNNVDGDDPGDGWWFDWNGGRGDGVNGGSTDHDGMSSLSDQDMYQDFVDNEWPQFCNAITPMDTQWHVGCRRIIHVFDNHRAASLAVLSLLVLLMLTFLLTYPCRVRQERRKLLSRQRQRLQQQHEQQNRDDTEDDDDEEQDPSGHGSLSLSSDEDATAAGQFAILEDDLVEENTNHDENVPLLMTQRSAPQQQYGSVVVDIGGGDDDTNTNTTGSRNDANNNNNHDKSNPTGDPTPSHGQPPPPKESNEIASSLFSTSSGRSWFFLQK